MRPFSWEGKTIPLLLSPSLHLPVQCSSHHYLPEYPCHSLSVPMLPSFGMTLCTAFKMLLRYLWLQSPFRRLASGSPVTLLFVTELHMHPGVLSVLPYERHTFDSWPAPQVRSLHNWTFTNHPLLCATPFPQPILPSEAFSEPLKDEIRKQVYLPQSVFYVSFFYQVRVSFLLLMQMDYFHRSLLAEEAAELWKLYALRSSI